MLVKPKGGLGKGLGALIPLDSSGPGGGGSYVLEVDVDLITANPQQPRHHMDPVAVRELAASIRQHGILQPLLVTRVSLVSGASKGPVYQLIAGERRWQAAKVAGLVRVPVVVKEASPQQVLELALIENIQRADLNPLEEAEAYQHLIADFGLTQDQVAQRVAKSPAAVSNTLRLLQSTAEAKLALADCRITEGHARALLALEGPQAQLLGLADVLKRGFSVRQTEEYVRRLAQGKRSGRAGRNRTTETMDLEEQFRVALGTKVDLYRARKGGRLVVYFYSDDQLQGLYEQIVS